MDHPALTRRAWMQGCGAAILAGGAGLEVAAGPAPARAGETLPGRTIVWQPWSSHASLAAADWKHIGELTRREGYARVLLQWSRYGTADFWPANGPRWLSSGLEHWRHLQLRLIVGLYMGDDYYRALQQSDEVLRAHMDDSQAKSLDQARRLLLHPPPQALDGWYLPQEIDDLNWRRPLRERMLTDYLARMHDALALLTPGMPQRPAVHASAFFSGASEPQQFADLLARLHRETGVVWVVQDGMGTHRLSDERTADYLRAIAHTLPPGSWAGILEVFDQKQAKGQPPTFEPSIDATVSRRMAVWRSSTGRQPEMTFSLNQRLAMATDSRR